tara:strand:- start:21159 stop:21785 length:627 start_codon:yes stop_codon:yes gene_type:complete
MPDPMTMMMAGQMIGSVMQSITGGYQQAEQMARQDMAFQQKEFERQLQVDAQNFAINQANANRLIKNRQMAVGAATQLAAKEYEINEGYQNSSRQLARAMATENATLTSNMAGRNIATGSGTAAALARLATINGSNSRKNLLQQKKIAQLNAKTQYQNIINQRDLTTQQPVYFVPGVSPVGDPDSAVKAGWTSALTTVAGVAVGAKIS